MPKSVFVTAGTGKQGRAVTNQLLQQSYTVHILTRNPSSATSKSLQSQGAILHTGDFTSQDVIQSILNIVDAVFLVLPAHPQDELIHAKTILNAITRSKTAIQIVYSGVARTGEHESFPGWSDAYPLAWYWKNKAAIEEMVRGSGVEYVTILRPAMFYSMFCRPDAEFMYPGLVENHELRLPFHESTQLDFIDPVDIAKFAVAAFEDPQRFTGKEISLAAEKLDAREMARQLSVISGYEIEVVYLSEGEARKLIAEGHVGVEAQLWQRDVGYGVDIDALKEYGIELRTMSQALDKAALGW